MKGRWYKLNEICSPKQWKTIASSELLSEGYPVYGANGVIGYYSEYTHTEETLLVTCRGATCGELNICQPFSYVNGNAMALDALVKEKVLVKFLYYYLKNRGFKDVISGSAQPQITGSNISKVKVFIPDINLQQRIVNILDKNFVILNKRKAQIEALDQLTQSVFLEMFGDPGKNPKNWPFGTIQDLTLKTQYGTSKKANENSGEFPILRMNNITYSGNWNFTDMKYIDLDAKESDKYLVYKGEVLFNRTNSKELVGKTAVYREEHPMAFAGYLVKLIPNEKANSEFISAYLNSKFGKAILLSMAKNIVGMANINAEELKKIKIYLPPKELQDMFANVIIKILDQRELLLKGLISLEESYNSLMQRAFKGELFTEEKISNQ